MAYNDSIEAYEDQQGQLSLVQCELDKSKELLRKLTENAVEIYYAWPTTEKAWKAFNTSIVVAEYFLKGR